MSLFRDHLLLTEFWNYFTQNTQITDALPQDIAINKSILNKTFYKLCGLIGVKN